MSMDYVCFLNCIFFVTFVTVVIRRREICVGRRGRGGFSG